ncbi:MAG: AsmA family protein [Myxococcota bacterium]
MKLLRRIAVGLVLLVVLAVGAALVALPRLLDDPSVRGRIEQAARDAVGRELRYAKLELGLLPPSLRAIDTALAGETPADPPLVEARQISLRVALLPLLFQTVLVDSLVVEGATLRLVRTADGIAWPRPDADAERAPRDDDAERGADGAEGEASGTGIDLAVREVRLVDTTLLLDDRSVRPAVAWEIRELDATASGRSLDGPIELDLASALGSGGSLAVSGTATRAGDLDLVLRLDDVALAPLAPYLGGDVERLAGRVGGRVSLAGPADALETLDADLSGADLDLGLGDLEVRGPVSAQASIARPTADADGSFELDVTDAELLVSGGFTKPPGTKARVTGRVAPADGGGLALEDVKLVIKNFEARGRLGSLDPLRVELSAEPFELAGWGALLPALADAAPEGRLGLANLRYTAAPQSLTGQVSLDDVSLRSGGAAPIVLDGRLRADGKALVSEALVARAAGQSVDLDARLDDLFGAPRWQVAAAAKDADSNAVVGQLFGKPDTLFGPLGLDATLRGTTGGDLLQALQGRVDFGIVDGKLAGVSLLKAVTDRLGAVGNLALDLGRAFGGRDLQRFYGDEFELLTGVLDIRDGVARTDDLRFVYQGYVATLRGTLGLADLALDMTGDLTIQPELDAEIAQELNLPDGYEPRSRVIPLAAVRGTLDAPKVRLADGAAVRVASAYASSGYGGELRDRVEGELGEGSGIIVDKGLEALEGLLGGGSKRKN